MALKKNFELKNGLIVPNAYIKISTCTSTKQSASALVCVYASKELADTGEPIYQRFQIFKPCYTDNAANLWKQAYEYLKGHPDFAGAEDILEDGQHA